jgi:hypothetical protein
VGLIARKSRWRVGSIDNHGGFTLVDPINNICVDGGRSMFPRSMCRILRRAE